MSFQLPAIKPEEILLFRKYVYDLTGIELGLDKGYLLEDRLAPMFEELKCSSFAELYNLCKSSSCKSFEKKLIDAIATHETSFFRNSAPFNLLKLKIIPDLIYKREQNRSFDSVPIPLSIWSAACSTGQEVYSIAIVLKELLHDLTPYSIRLLGSDISGKSIKKAMQGYYNEFEMNRGLSPGRTQLYFKKTDGGWVVDREIRALASFQQLNLMEPFTEQGKFDIIFCRNVANYFSLEKRKKFFKNISRSMRSGGYLIIGSTESLAELSDIFVVCQYMDAHYYQLRSAQ